MTFAAGLSREADAERAVHDAIEQIRSAAPGANSFDFATVFFSPRHSGDADSIAQTLIDQLHLGALIGCSCDGVMGGATEAEKGPAISILVGRAPDVHVHPVHIGRDQWERVTADAADFVDQFGVSKQTRGILLLGDPWTTPITPLLSACDRFAPGVPLIGGMASAARRAGENVLLFNDGRFDEGIVALSFTGAINIDPIVSQGCRPIGKPYVITKATDNIVEQLGGKPALVVLEETVNSLSDADRELLGYGLMLGRAMTEYKDSFGRGDFVVRNIVGVHEAQQALGVGDRVRVGQTVQFHVRDALSAHEDLKHMLEQRKSKTPAAALCFSCNGRGTNLFPQPHHDAALMQQLMPGLPLAGFFAAGEIGPVGARNFIHGHTASIALFSTP